MVIAETAWLSNIVVAGVEGSLTLVAAVGYKDTDLENPLPSESWPER